MIIEDRYVTVSEAATIFGVPRRTLYRWIASGEYLQLSASEPSRGHTGRVMVFRLSEVAAAIATRHAEKTGASDPIRGVAQSGMRSHV